MSTPGLPSLVQRFFTQRLLEQQGLSTHTVASYRDTFRLLLAYAAQHVGRAPSDLQMEQLDVSLIENFLRHLEQLLVAGFVIGSVGTRLKGVAKPGDGERRHDR